MNEMRKLIETIEKLNENNEATKDYCPEDPEGHEYSDNSGLCSLCGYTDQAIVEDCDESNEDNDDGECSPFTHADDNVDMVREETENMYVFHWRDGSRNEGPGTGPEDALNRLGFGQGSLVALDYWEKQENVVNKVEEDDFDDDYNSDFEPATNICPDCEGRGHLGHLNKGEEFDCPRCDGMGEVFEDMTREDYLIPPKNAYDNEEASRQDAMDRFPDDYASDMEDKATSGLDFEDDDIEWGEPGVGRSYDATDLGDAEAYDDFEDSYFSDKAHDYSGIKEDEFGLDSKNPRTPVDHCATCGGWGEIEQDGDDVPCPNPDCNAYIGEQAPGEEGDDFWDWTEKYPGEELGENGSDDEFDYDDDDAIVDVGDDEDYEEFDFDNEFEDMMGNTMKYESYDINEIRRMAGLPVKEVDYESSENFKDLDKDLDDEYIRDMEFQLRNKADKDQEVEEASHSKDDYDAFEFMDEKAYYLVSDEIGDRIEFGMHDEILVPEQYTDGIIALLVDHGFIDGEDFSVAGMTEDLQNGYNDRHMTDGEDYFPRGATSSPAGDVGPGASNQGDNPMRSPMASVHKDEEEIYESYRKSYRRFRRK